MRRLAGAVLACTPALLACGRVGFDRTSDGGDGESSVLDPVTVPSWTSGTRLRARLADFGNGAIEVAGWYDSLLDTNCDTNLTLADGVQRCAPNTSTNVVYTDSLCTAPVAVWTRNSMSDPTPRFANQIDTDSHWHMFPVTGMRALSSYYYVSGGTCVGPYSAQASSVFLDIGPEVSASMFLPITDTVAGTGRLQATGWSSEDGTTYYTGLRDAQLDLPCFLASTSKGIACVPTGHDGESFFSDAACTQHVALINTGGRGDGVSRLEGCNELHRYELGAPYTGPTYSMTTGSCASFTSSFEFALIGPELDPARYVLGAESLGSNPGRLVERRWIGDEGSTVHRGWLDTVREEPCSYATGPAFGGTRCLPRTLGSLGEYGDAGCTVPIAVLDNPSCTGFEYIFNYDSRAPSMNAIDTSAAAPTQLFRYLGGCNAAMLKAGATYVVGSATPIPLDQFAAGTERIE